MLPVSPEALSPHSFLEPHGARLLQVIISTVLSSPAPTVLVEADRQTDGLSDKRGGPFSSQDSLFRKQGRGRDWAGHLRL